MPTQEELNAAQAELNIANDNYAQLANRYNQYQKLFQEYAKSSPEIQNKAANAMWRALEDFYQIQEKMRTAEDRIAVAQNAVNSYNELLAQQPVQQTITRNGYNSGRNIPPTNNLDWRRDTPETINDVDNREWIPVYNDKWEIVWEQRITPDYQIWAREISRPSSFTGRKAIQPTQSATNETWEDIYNAGGWNEFKKWFNNALVDDLVLPVASAFGASDDTLWILSELKMPATEREKASKYYAYWWWGKDAADAYLQYAAMKWLTSIPKLVSWAKWAGNTYTVANSSRWIYNRPGARETVNRAWSNYSPAYLNRTTSAIKQTPKISTTPSTSSASSFRTLTPTQTNNFWRYADAHQNEPILSTVRNFTNWYL